MEGFRVKALDVAMIGICAALYAVVGRLTDLGITFGGVAFWPAAVIPAVFAVLFGPWVGGIGAAIGIFIRDMLFHGNPLLSLSAGVPPNFAEFFIIGYFSHSNFSRRKMILGALVGSVVVVAGLLLPAFLLPNQLAGYVGKSLSISVLLLLLTVGGSLLVIVIVSKKWSEWRKFGIGAIIGQGIGAAILSVAVWAYSQAFASSTNYFKTPLSSGLIPLIFVWTFATEIPFILILGPPIVRACYRAFPSLTKSIKNKTEPGTNS
jgi:uncharacterized membrane protein